MSRATSNPIRGWALIGVLFLGAALVMVPTVMRARQHVRLHSTTRLSIRLNLQGDVPPRIASAAPDPDSAARPVPLQQPDVAPRSLRADRFLPDEPLERFRDDSPDPLRGPPVAPFGLSASVAS